MWFSEFPSHDDIYFVCGKLSEFYVDTRLSPNGGETVLYCSTSGLLISQMGLEHVLYLQCVLINYGGVYTVELPMAQPGCAKYLREKKMYEKLQVEVSWAMVQGVCCL